MRHEKNGITQAKIALIEKIITAKLTKEELQAVTDKANEIIDRRPCSAKSKGKGEKVLHEIPIYDGNDIDGILKETLCNP